MTQFTEAKRATLPSEFRRGGKDPENCTKNPDDLKKGWRTFPLLLENDGDEGDVFV